MLRYNIIIMIVFNKELQTYKTAVQDALIRDQGVEKGQPFRKYMACSLDQRYKSLPLIGR